MEHDLPLIDEQQQQQQQKQPLQQPKKEKTFHTQSRWRFIVLTFLLIWPIVFFLLESSAINQYKAAEKNTHKKKKLDCSNNNNYVFQKNSKQWLDSPRHSNINETLITDKQIEELILDISPMKTTDGSKHILGQSLCLAESAFMNWDQKPRITSPTTDNNNDDDKDRIRELAFKLVFLAIHEHQFGPARREALTRYSDERCLDDGDDSRKKQLEEYKASLKNAKVGKFDFECPDTKYLISDVGSKGFGATMRVGMIDPMFVGLVTNRTVLYVSSFDSHTVDKSFQTPWPLASCPRKDMQCVYMPVTPCVLTKEEIQNGLIVPEKVVANARKTGTFGKEYDDAKVLMMKSSLGGHKPTPKLLMPTFIRIIESFYANNGEEENETYKESRSSSIGGAPWELDKETLTNVSEFLLSGSNDVRWLPHQATSFFLTRPSMESRKKIDDALQRILPDNFDPATTVGFPIRGSDKCHRESECLTFEDYTVIMREFIAKREKALAEQQNKGSNNVTLTHIMLTSEHKDIINARLDYTNDPSFPYNFIVNEEDTGQGTGEPKAFQDSADDIMISSLISIKMQLHTESIIYNDCSNFHKIMIELSLHDCGVQNYLEKYKQNDNPKYRMKCAWGRV